MPVIRFALIAIAATVFCFAGLGCEDKDTFENAGEEVDKALDDAGEALEDAGDEVEEAADELGDDIDDE